MPTAPPPVAPGDGWEEQGYRDRDAEYEGSGKVSTQVWSYVFEADDATYVKKMARVVVTPPESSVGSGRDDVENFQFTLSAPMNDSADTDCELIDWEPKEDGGSYSVAGFVALPPSIGLGPGFGTNSNTVEVESGGPDFMENADWDIDLDDFSNTAQTRVSVTLGGLWKCPKDHRVSVHEGSSLSLEIDDWGSDSHHYFDDGELWVEEDEDEVASLELPDDQLAAIIVDQPGFVGALPGSNFGLKARVFSTPELLASVEAIATDGVSNLPMEVGDLTPFGEMAYVEVRANLTVPERQAWFEPEFIVSFANGEEQHWKGRPSAIALPLYPNMALDGPKTEGSYAYQLQGPKGEWFTLDVTRTGWCGYYRVLEKPGGQPLRANTDGSIEGVFRERGPILVLALNKVDIPPQVCLRVPESGC